MCTLRKQIQLYLSCIVFLVATPLFVFAQTTNSLPIATTLEIENAETQGGEIVVFDEKSNSYDISKDAKDVRVYGVTAQSPALVFTTASGTIPVVTSGITKVQANIQNGPVKRGDLLTSSDKLGTAMRAGLSDDAVFAIALEDFFGVGTATTTGFVVVEVGVEQARSIQESRRAFEKQNADALLGSTSTTTGDLKDKVSFIRASIAAVIAIIGLSFILFSFRSTIAKGVISIGRNPRARTSIITLAFGNIVFALILCAVVIFIAVGVLVLPV